MEWNRIRKPNGSGGFLEFWEDGTEWLDSDEDGIGNNADLDDDTHWSTGVGDGIEDVDDKFPYDPTEWADNDMDGTGDNADPDDDNDGVPDEEDEDPTNPNVGKAGSSIIWIVLILAIVGVVVAFFLLQKNKK